MRLPISVCAAALLGAAVLCGSSPVIAAAPGLDAKVAPAAAAAPATDFSARRRAQRHVRSTRKAYRGHVPPRYYARPYDYRPSGVAPFFPFRYGYGLDPSW
jgi:hypothetical protein